MSVDGITNEVYLSFVYDGEALKSHTLEAGVLSDIYKGIDELIKCANTVLNGDGTVEIVTEAYVAEGGCIKIPLRFREITRQTGAFFSFIGKNEKIIGITAILNLLGLIDSGNKYIAYGADLTLLYSVIAFYLQTSGKKIEKSEEDTDGHMSIVVDGKKYSTRKQVLELANHEGVRKNTKKILSPLAREGIQKFEVRDGKEQSLRKKITKQEAESFLKASEQQECLNETVSSMLLSIEKISFKQKNKWKFSDGGNRFSAVIKDQKFLNAIDNDKISFSKNNLLHANVKLSQKIANNQIQSTYEITEILEILPPKPSTDGQLSLNFDNNNSPNKQ